MLLKLFSKYRNTHIKGLGLSPVTVRFFSSGSWNTTSRIILTTLGTRNSFYSQNKENIGLHHSHTTTTNSVIGTAYHHLKKVTLYFSIIHHQFVGTNNGLELVKWLKYYDNVNIGSEWLALVDCYCQYRVWMIGSGRLSLRNCKFLELNYSEKNSTVPNVLPPSAPTQPNVTQSSSNPDAQPFAHVPTQIPQSFKHLENFNNLGPKE